MRAEGENAMIRLNDVSVDQLSRALRDARGTNLDHLCRTILTGCGLEADPARMPTGHGDLARPLGAWLADTSADAMEAVRDGLGDLVERPCDPLGAALLRDTGVNPFALLAIERLMHLATNKGHTVTWNLETIAHISLSEQGWDRTIGDDRIDVVHVRLARGVWWDGVALSMDEDALPRTALHSLTGRPLGAVVDVPGCEPVSIIDARATPVCTWTITTDRRCTPTSWANALMPITTEIEQ